MRATLTEPGRGAPDRQVQARSASLARKKALPRPSARPCDRRSTIIDGKRLRRLRLKHGLSQEALASLAGVSLTAIRRLERQVRANCRIRTLARLAGALGVDPYGIVARDPVKPS